MTLREIRKESHFSQEKLANAVGVKRLSIARYEAGTRRPTPEVARRIADVLHITTEQMWDMFYSADHAQQCG